MARVLKAFGAAIGLLRNGFVAVPLALYFILKLCVIALYVGGRSGPAARLWHVLLSGSGAEALAHSPDRLIVMPIVLGRLDILLEIFVLSLAQALTVLLVSGASRGEGLSMRDVARAARARYFHLIAATAIISAAIFAFFTYPPSLLAHPLGIPNAGMLIMGIALSIVVQAFSVYAIPFIVLDGRPAVGALGRSVAFAARHLGASITLVVVPFIITLPTLLLALDPRVVAFRISPEFLVHVRIAGELVEFASGYLLVGGLTLYLLAARTKEENT